VIKNLYYKFLDWVYPELNMLINKFDENHRILEEIRDTLEEEKNILKEEIAFYKTLSEELIANTPDMVWLKDTEGKYIVANRAIRDGLLFDSYPIGKDDITMALNAKEKYGSDNHTFGEVCGNSDLVVLDKLKAERFLEHGKVKGKTMYLEVYKFPFYVDGNLVGVAGIGRDMTDYVVAYREHNCAGCDKMRDVFRKYEFEV
jgi:PAS domain-containing protein